MKVVEAFGWFWKFVFLKSRFKRDESVDTSGRLKPNTCASATCASGSFIHDGKHNGKKKDQKRIQME
jgi:hypothetical protein